MTSPRDEFLAAWEIYFHAFVHRWELLFLSVIAGFAPGLALLARGDRIGLLFIAVGLVVLTYHLRATHSEYARKKRSRDLVRASRRKREGRREGS